MKVIDFEITFELNGKQIEASCQKMKVQRVPQIRIVFGNPMKERVYTVYEINEPKKKYFWFALPDKREEENIRAITRALSRSIKAKGSIE